MCVPFLPNTFHTAPNGGGRFRRWLGQNGRLEESGTVATCGGGGRCHNTEEFRGVDLTGCKSVATARKQRQEKCHRKRPMRYHGECMCGCGVDRSSCLPIQLPVSRGSTDHWFREDVTSQQDNDVEGGTTSTKVRIFVQGGFRIWMMTGSCVNETWPKYVLPLR